MNCGFLYKIQDNSNPKLVYYGSSELTTLDERMDIHIKNFNYWKKTGKNYCSSFKVLELGNWKPTLLKIIFFTIKWELWEHERKLIEGQVCVNKNVPNRSRAEWCEANPNYHAEWCEANPNYYADYKLKNKDKINKKFACECGGKYTHQNKLRHIKSNKHQKWVLSQL